MTIKQFGKTILGSAMGLTLMAGAATAPAQAQDYTINIVFLANENDEDYDGSLVFEDWVESRSNGRIAVEIFPGGQLCGNPNECIEGLQSGVLDVFITTIGGLSNVFPPAQVMDVPYMFANDRVAECALSNDSEFTQALGEAVLDQTGNMRLMTIGNTGGWRNFATVGTQVRTPADVEGLRIRTISSEIQQELVRAMGGTPTPVAWGELYTAFATGVVEGSKNGITDIIGMSFHDHLDNMTLDGHAYMGALWWMNNDVFSSMPEDLQRIVQDGFDRLRITTLVMPQRRQIEAYNAFREAGGTVYVPTPDELALFREAAAPIRDWFVDNVDGGDEWLALLDSSVAACEAEINAGYAN